MSGFADEAGPHAALAVDGRDYAYGEVFLLQHGSLLYVDLAVAEKVPFPAAVQGAGIAEGADRFPEGHAVPVFEVQAALVEGAGIHGAAQEGRAEAQALLVGESDHLYGVGEAFAAVVQLLDASECDHDAELAVVPARVAHGVEVGAEDQRLIPRPS